MKTNFLSTFLLAACGAAFLLLAGCSPESAHPEEIGPGSDDREAVFELFERMQEEAFREAFRSLPERTFLRYERTEQRDGSSRLERMVERVLRHTPGGEREVVAMVDSVGTFDDGRPPEFLVGNGLPFEDLHRHVLPDEPAYASRREAEAFEYRLEEDTTLWSRTIHVASIQARPQLGDAQSIRYARLYVDETSGELVGMYLQQVDQGWLFGENTTLDIRLRPNSNDDEWVPQLLRVHTELRAAFLPRRVFRSIYAFYDYE